MYLFIFEDGGMTTKDDITQDDLDAWDSGFIDIVRVQDIGSGVMSFEQYNENEWYKVEEI